MPDELEEIRWAIAIEELRADGDPASVGAGELMDGGHGAEPTSSHRLRVIV